MRSRSVGPIYSSCVRVPRPNRACFFGMLTGALFDIGQYTTRTQVLRLREVWEARCERSCRFMRASLTLSGSQRLARVFDTEVRGGYFTLCGCVVKVRFSCVRGDTIFTATPESDDLWTQVVRAMRGEITGVPPTYRHKPGQTFEYTHSRLRCMAIEMVHTGHALIDGVGLGVWMDGIVEPVFDRRDDLAVEALRLPPRMPPVHAPSLDELLVAKQPTERNHAAVRKPDAATCAGCTAADPVGSGARHQHTRTHVACLSPPSPLYGIQARSPRSRTRTTSRRRGASRRCHPSLPAACASRSASAATRAPTACSAGCTPLVRASHAAGRAARATHASARAAGCAPSAARPSARRWGGARTAGWPRVARASARRAQRPARRPPTAWRARRRMRPTATSGMRKSASSKLGWVSERTCGSHFERFFCSACVCFTKYFSY